MSRPTAAELSSTSTTTVVRNGSLRNGGSRHQNTTAAATVPGPASVHTLACRYIRSQPRTTRTELITRITWSAYQVNAAIARARITAWPMPMTQTTGEAATSGTKAKIGGIASHSGIETAATMRAGGTIWATNQAW